MRVKQSKTFAAKGAALCSLFAVALVLSSCRGSSCPRWDPPSCDPGNPGGGGSGGSSGGDSGTANDPGLPVGIRVYFNGGGGNPETYYITIPAVPYTVALPGSSVFSREGYALAGWSRSGVHANAPVYEADFLVEFASMTLFARWVDESALYETVTFSSSRHTGGTVPAPLRVFDGYQAAIPYAAPARAGFVFLGWHRDENSGVAEYQPGDVINSSIATGAVFYAVWRPYYWRTVSAGVEHVIGIARDGTLWAPMFSVKG